MRHGKGCDCFCCEALREAFEFVEDVRRVIPGWAEGFGSPYDETGYGRQMKVAMRLRGERIARERLHERTHVQA